MNEILVKRGAFPLRNSEVLEKSERQTMTYLDDKFLLVDSEPATLLELLFRSHLSHGPGSDEEMESWIGRNSSGQHQILWLKSDWSDDPGLQAVAWMEADNSPPKEAGAALLCELWQAEKDRNESDRPTHDEVIKSPPALLSAKEVAALALVVWPK